MPRGLDKEQFKTDVKNLDVTAADVSSIFDTQSDKDVFAEAISELTDAADETKLYELCLHTIFGDGVKKIGSDTKLKEILAIFEAEFLSRNTGK